MAERCLLHQNKLDWLKWWLTSRGYEMQPVKGYYEVLRAKKGNDTVIIYKKLGAKEHLTVQQKDYGLIRQFIRECKENLYGCLEGRRDIVSSVLGTEDGR